MSAQVHGVAWLLIRAGHVVLERCPKKAAVLGVGEWFIPGGKVENGEHPNATLAREINEEWPGVTLTGYRPLPLVEGSRIPPGDAGLFLMRPYLVTVCGVLSDRSGDGVDLQWVPLEIALRSPVPQVRMMVAAAMGMPDVSGA